MKWIFQRFSSPQKCATCSGFSVRHAPDLLCDIDRIQCATCSGLCSWLAFYFSSASFNLTMIACSP
jgi:hypothetical protein